jgi:hypothetical protein
MEQMPNSLRPSTQKEKVGGRLLMEKVLTEGDHDPTARLQLAQTRHDLGTCWWTRAGGTALQHCSVGTSTVPFGADCKHNGDETGEGKHAQRTPPVAHGAALLPCVVFLQVLAALRQRQTSTTVAVAA